MQPKLRFVLVVLAAALLALPAGAAAGTKSKSITVAGDGAIGTADAKCPGGQQATGGGFRVPAVSSGSPNLVVYESRKVGQRKWRASGQIFDSGATSIARTITAFAYCSSDGPSTKSKSASVTATATNAFFAVDSKCSSGKAQAGGFRGPPPKAGSSATHFVVESVRSGKKTWHSRMAATGSAGVGVTFTSYVYCADQGNPGARLGNWTSSLSNAPATAISNKCPGNKKPVAGGFSQPNATFVSPSGLFGFIYDTTKTGNRWRVSADHIGTTSTTLNSIAYCA
jgi:hypothetical protein